jgi:hypothetical protein
MALLSWPILLDGFESTADNAAGAVPAIAAESGLEGAGETDRLRTVFGLSPPTEHGNQGEPVATAELQVLELRCAACAEHIEASYGPSGRRS